MGDQLGEVRSRSLYTTTGIRLDVSVDAEDNLRFEGKEMSSGLEYGYEYAVDADQVGKLRASLGAPADTDVLDLVEEHRDELINTGEVTWLRGLGIEGVFSSHMSR